jgi:uncharacterized membrane protein
MIILAIFALITVILFFLNVGGFTAQASASTGTQTGMFLAITIIVIVIAVIGAIAALLLRWSFKREEKYSEHSMFPHPFIIFWLSAHCASSANYYE